jgi:menaquinone-dependent protoporphyrinogen oxidase
MKGIIIYATKYGCTEKAVKLLQSDISEEIKTVNVVKEKAPDLSLYDTVILGGPIYIGKMHRELSDYMKQNCEVLKTKRLALFICAGEQNPALMKKQLASAFPEELYNHAIIREVFGGELHLNKMNLITKLILRVVKGITADYSRLSKEKIDCFARGIFY